MKRPLDPFRLAVLSIACWLTREQQDVIHYLREENCVLREMLGERRLRFSDRQRRRLALRGRALHQTRSAGGAASPRHRWVDPIGRPEAPAPRGRTPRLRMSQAPAPRNRDGAAPRGSEATRPGAGGSAADERPELVDPNGRAGSGSVGAALDTPTTRGQEVELPRWGSRQREGHAVDH